MTDRLFVYGTLQPGASAWGLLEPYVVGTPRPAELAGVLYDTRQGYPALRLGGGSVVPGWVVQLREPSAAALSAMDAYEGAEYRRVRVRLADGVECWTYEWIAGLKGLSQLSGPWHAVRMIDDSDPLTKITLSPRGFTAVLATVALLVGLILALIPVHVAGPDPAMPGSVSCGNTIGGVETGSVAAGLNQADRSTIVSYVDMCERAISDRIFYSWPLFFGGGLVIIYMGVVRHRPASPD